MDQRNRSVSASADKRRYRNCTARNIRSLWNFLTVHIFCSHRPTLQHPQYQEFPRTSLPLLRVSALGQLIVVLLVLPVLLISLAYGLLVPLHLYPLVPLQVLLSPEPVPPHIPTPAVKGITFGLSPAVANQACTGTCGLFHQ